MATVDHLQPSLLLQVTMAMVMSKAATLSIMYTRGIPDTALGCCRARVVMSYAKGHDSPEALTAAVDINIPTQPWQLLAPIQQCPVLSQVSFVSLAVLFFF